MDIRSELESALAGRYAVQGEIGRGGMATVFLAEDLKHGRRVALKVLEPELSSLLGVERFLAEIRVTASLQHPNLLPLFDSGDAGGLPFYVMPFVDGESLRARLARTKQLTVDAAVRIGVAIAGALDYAHRSGVIHRDLKPENILLRDDQPLVADFGIALALSVAGGSRITQSGISIGTPQYSSPEQATGDRMLDARTDVYSLGAVIYEMLTGEPPHTGATAQAVIARVITDPVPDIRATRPNVPAFVNTAVLKALEKLPADRWQSAREFADALTSARVETNGARSDLFASRQTGKSGQLARLAPWVLAAALALGAGVVGWVGRRTSLPVSVVRFYATLPDSLSLRGQSWEWSVALTPDGSRVAYVGGPANALNVRAVDDLASRALPGTEGARCPSFSPDGNWLVFGTVAGLLKRAPLNGGPPIVLVDSGGTRTERYEPDECGSWLDRDAIIFGTQGALYRVPVNGGAPSLVAQPLPGNYYYNPRALPGGTHVLITFGENGVGRPPELAMISVADGRLTRFGVAGSDAQYVSSGHIVFVLPSGTIVAAPFSLRSRRITGSPTPIATGAVLNEWRDGSLSVSENGALAYLAGDQSSARLYTVDSLGNAHVSSGPTGSAVSPRLSPDGSRVALEVAGGVGEWDIWVYDLRSTTLTRVTSNASSFRPAGWSTDGKRVIYVATDSATLSSARRVVSVPWDRSGPPNELLRVNATIDAASAGPPHSYLAASVTQRGQSDIWIAPLDTPSAARAFAASGASESQPRLSPNGKLLAYSSDETGLREVYVREVSGSGATLLVSSGGGAEPVWNATGSRLYYRGPRRIMRATIGTRAELKVSRRDSLFDDVYHRGEQAQNFDVFPVSEQLLMLRTDSRPRLVVVLNWPALLR